MAAPTFETISALNSGSGSTARSPAVPAGVTSGSLVFALVTVNQIATASPPTDFTEAASTGTSAPTLRAHWKRATGADAGTYSVAHGGNVSGTSDALTIRFEGEEDDTNPIGQTNTAQATGTGNPATSLTGVQVDSLLVHVVSSSNSRNYTPPAGFTRRTADSFVRLHVSTMVSPGGSTGSIAGSLDGLAVAQSAMLIEIRPIAAIVETRTGSAVLTLAATSLSREVEKSAAPAALTLAATASSFAVFRTTGTAALALVGSATAVPVEIRTGSATLDLDATGTATPVFTRTGTATITLTSTGIGIADGGIATRTGTATITLTGSGSASTDMVMTRTGTASLNLTATAVALLVLIRTGQATITLTATATATPVLRRTGTATTELDATAAVRTIHPRTGAATLLLNPTATARVVVIEPRTGAADLTLTATATSTVTEWRDGTATFTLDGLGILPQSTDDVAIVSIVERSRTVTITERPRTIRATERPRTTTIQERP